MILQSQVPAAESTWKERLFAEGPKAWAELQEFYSHSEGSYTETRKHYMEKDPTHLLSPTRVTNHVFAISGDLFKLTHMGKHGEGIDVLNSRYFFNLHRNKKGDPYALEQFASDVAATSRLRQNLDAVRQELLMDVCAPWFFYEPLPVIMRDPTFHIKNVSEQHHKGALLVRVDFEASEIRTKGHERPAISRGYILLDPSQYWTIREYEIQGPRRRPP